MKAKDKVIKLLRKNDLFFVPEHVRWVIETYNLEAEDKETLIQEVLTEGLERTVNIVHTFFETVSDAPLPKEVEGIKGHLQRGETVSAWCFSDWSKNPLGGTQTYVDVGDGKNALKFSLCGSGVLKGLQLTAFTGVVNLYATDNDSPVTRTKDLSLGSWCGDGQAFFMGNKEEALEKALEIAASLRPVLSVMGLSDLEEKFAVLGAMREGERRIEGDYTLIRDRQVWFLKRGSFMGDPDLDRALLEGEFITLTFPGNVEIAFKAEFSFDAQHLAHKVSLTQGHFRFGEEIARFGPEDGFFSFLMGANNIEFALRYGLSRKFDRWERTGDGSFFEGLSPKAIASLKALAELKDPFWFLAKGEFYAHSTAQLFVDF
jgi:hypothetical protein